METVKDNDRQCSERQYKTVSFYIDIIEKENKLVIIDLFCWKIKRHCIYKLLISVQFRGKTILMLVRLRIK